MEQSFNDQELSDIMKEIEALEQGFKTEEVNTPVSGTAEFESSAQSDELENKGNDEESQKIEVVASDESINNVLPLDIEEESDFSSVGNSAPSHSVPVASSSMTFKVQGQLSLDLKFEIGSKVVCLEINESEFSIQMEGGVKFTIPVHEKSELKKAV